MQNDLSRRDFHRLTSAALGGLAAGTWLGCSPATKQAEAATELHVCRGLNTCKSHGTDGKNACAGQGNCAVPLGGDMWTKARAKFESRMKQQGKEFGTAPPAKGS